MARRKKRVYSTKPKAKPQPQKVVLPEQEKPSVLLTLDEAIDKFKQNPKKEQFWCPGKKGFALAVGNMYLQFKDHFFTTSNPAEIEALMRSNAPGAKYNVHFFAMNPELRNIK